MIPIYIDYSRNGRVCCIEYSRKGPYSLTNLNKEVEDIMNKFVLPHMYLFFGFILLILAEYIIPPLDGYYAAAQFVSRLSILIGIIWIFILLFKKIK